MVAPLFDAAGSVAPDPANSITCSSMTGQEYDVVVVGSGAAGMVAALTAAHEGLSTVVIEKAPTFRRLDRSIRRGRVDPEQRGPQARRCHRHTGSRAHISARHHRRHRRARAHRRVPRPGARDVVVRAEAHAAEDVLGPGLFGLLPRGSRWPARRALDRAEAVRRAQAGPRRARPRTAVRQGAAQCRGDATGLRAAEHAQASSPGGAAQPEGGRPDHVGEGDRQEPGRHGARVDRSAADRAARRRCAGVAQHRA